MKFSMRSSVARLAVLAAAMLCVMAAGQETVSQTTAPTPTTLEFTAAPTPTPFTAAPTPTPEDGDRELEFTAAPTMMPTTTSGASSWRSSASVASGLVLVGSVAAAAMVV